MPIPYLSLTVFFLDYYLGQTAVHRWLKQYDAEMTGQAGIGFAHHTCTTSYQRVRREGNSVEMKSFL